MKPVVYGALGTFLILCVFALGIAVAPALVKKPPQTAAQLAAAATTGDGTYALVGGGSIELYSFVWRVNRATGEVTYFVGTRDKVRELHPTSWSGGWFQSP